MRKKIAIIYPKFGKGGSEPVALRMVEALKDEYDVFLITSGKFDISALNKSYNTDLSLEDFSLIQVKMPFGIENTDKFSALRGRFIQRYCQKISGHFDVMLSAYNPMDFKVGGLQYVADMAELPEIISLSGFQKLFYGKTILRKVYLKLCDLVSPLNLGSLKGNFTLSNSDWTAQLMFKRYGIKAKTVYPPVSSMFPKISFEKRENGFICIGRITPEKRFDVAIEILKQVRQKGHNIHLHIIGRMDNSNYARFLAKKCLENKEWVFIEDNLDEEEKNNLIVHHCFGISCRKNEPFGIAVAEMVNAGCIVFVPDGGGQTEIVKDEALIYKDIEDAVDRIDKVLKDDTVQIELLSHLALQTEKFPVENFKKEIKKIIKDYLSYESNF